MKQAERNRKGRARILSHALAEFAANGYAGSSLNLLCAYPCCRNKGSYTIITTARIRSIWPACSRCLTS